MNRESKQQLELLKVENDRQVEEIKREKLQRQRVIWKCVRC